MSAKHCYVCGKECADERTLLCGSCKEKRSHRSTAQYINDAGSFFTQRNCVAVAICVVIALDVWLAFRSSERKPVSAQSTVQEQRQIVVQQKFDATYPPKYEPDNSDVEAVKPPRPPEEVVTRK